MFDLLVIGLLFLCFGEVIKFLQDLFDVDKMYEIVVWFGIKMSIVDVEGEVLSECLVLVMLE